MTHVEQSILEKIQKLFEHAESAQQIGSLAEAETFMAKAQNLLMQYNLTIGEVKQAGEKKDKAVEGMTEKFGTKEQGKTWEAQLCFGIANANLCEGLSGRYHVYFIGTKQNVELCQYMFGFIAPKLQRMARDSFNDHMKPIKAEYSVNAMSLEDAMDVMENNGHILFHTYGERDVKQTKPNKEGIIKFHFHKEMKEHPDFLHVHTYIRNYLEGAADGIRTRLNSEMRQLRAGAQGEQVAALVKVHNDLADEFIKEKYPNAKPSSRRESGYSAATHKGYNDAKSMQLNKGIGAKAAAQKQLK